MVGQKKLVNVLLPEELYQALVCYQQQQGLAEVKEACAEILAQFFHKESGFKRYATVEQLVALQEKVTHLSEQVALLSPKKAGNANPQAARTVSALGNEQTHPTLSAQPPQVAMVNTSLEEDYEEPDEILYDFLEPGSTPY